MQTTVHTPPIWAGVRRVGIGVYQCKDRVEDLIGRAGTGVYHYGPRYTTTIDTAAEGTALYPKVGVISKWTWHLKSGRILFHTAFWHSFRTSFLLHISENHVLCGCAGQDAIVTAFELCCRVAVSNIRRVQQTTTWNLSSAQTCIWRQADTTHITIVLCSAVSYQPVDQYKNPQPYQQTAACKQQRKNGKRDVLFWIVSFRSFVYVLFPVYCCVSAPSCSLCVK